MSVNRLVSGILKVAVGLAVAAAFAVNIGVPLMLVWLIFGWPVVLLAVMAFPFTAIAMPLYVGFIYDAWRPAGIMVGTTLATIVIIGLQTWYEAVIGTRREGR